MGNGQVETTCLNTRQTCSYNNLQDYLKSIRDIKNVKIQKIARSQTGHGVYVVNLTSNDEEDIRHYSNLTDTNSTKIKKITVWIDGVINPTDWVSLPACVYILEQLIHPGIEDLDLRSGIDWYIAPLCNPSGYEFSRTLVRRWKKNFRKRDCPCVHCGVNLNRNFDIHFYDGVNDPCSDNYRGAYPASESEVKGLSDFLGKLAATNIDLYISFQTNTDGKPRILIPWAHTNKKCPEYRKLYKIAKWMSKVVRKDSGNHYSVEHSASKQLASGTSADFAKAIGSRFVYSIQLPKESKDLLEKDAFNLVASGVRKLKKMRDTRSARSKALKHQIRIENITCALLLAFVSIYFIYYSTSL